MATHTTRWKPDTCDCILEYDWEDSLPEDQRTHTPTGIVKKCFYHSQENTTKEAHFQRVLDENKEKNGVLSSLLKDVPEAFEDEDVGGGKKTKKLKENVKYNWTFDENRKLVVNFEGLTPEQETKIEQTIKKNSKLLFVKAKAEK